MSNARMPGPSLQVGTYMDPDPFINWNLKQISYPGPFMNRDLKQVPDPIFYESELSGNMGIGYPFATLHVCEYMYFFVQLK